MRDISPNAKELVRREAQLRREILGTSIDNTPRANEVFSESTRPIPSNYTSRATDRVLPEPEPELEIETTTESFGDPSISIVDLETNPAQVVTSLGTYELDADEEAKIAFIVLEAISRNLQIIIDQLNAKHGVQQMLQKQKQILEEQFAGQQEKAYKSEVPDPTPRKMNSIPETEVVDSVLPEPEF